MNDLERIEGLNIALNDPSFMRDYEIYQKVRHALYVRDAKEKVQEYLVFAEKEGIFLDPEMEFDYSVLAKNFELRKSADMADSETWDQLIDEYAIKQNELLNEERMKLSYGSVDPAPNLHTPHGCFSLPCGSDEKVKTMAELEF